MRQKPSFFEIGSLPKPIFLVELYGVLFHGVFLAETIKPSLPNTFSLSKYFLMPGLRLSKGRGIMCALCKILELAETYLPLGMVSLKYFYF